MAEEKTPAFDETKWWIDRGPAVKEREKTATPEKGIIEKWAYELLKNYNQDQAAKNLVDINAKLLQGLAAAPGEWGYYSLEIGNYPPEKLAKIKSSLPLPPNSRGLVIDAGYSIRIIITGEPAGARFVDINFTDQPSLDYWVNGQLVEERVYANVGEALKRVRAELPRYLPPRNEL
jgi:hypothetical protein